MLIDGQRYQLGDGALALISTVGGQTLEKQLKYDLASLPIEVEELRTWVVGQEKIKSFF